VEHEIDRLTVTSTDLAVPRPSGKVQCAACSHRCKVAPGKRGICRVRFVADGGLRVPWGYTGGVAVDPIEKKPFFHVRPGCGALSFGMIGCDMHCAFCQNWLSAHALRDGRPIPRVQPTSVEQLVSAARASGCEALISTYNEPLISAEWAHAVFARAKEHGLLTGLVSNGHGTPEVLDYLRPVTDLFKVDLKAFREASYRQLGGHLRAVTETIAGILERGFWLEVVTLVVPEFNDSAEELRDMASFLAGLSRDIPWHVTAFHPDYQMTDRGRTPAATLARARAIGLDQGLRFVYAGNLPGALRHGEDTLCPGCGEVLVERVGFTVTSNRLTVSGTCSRCGTEIPGAW